MARHDFLRASLEFRNASRAMPQDPESYYQMALADLELRDGRGAVEMLRKTLALNSHHIGAQLKMAELLSGTNDREAMQDAGKRLKEVLALAPDNGDALSSMALNQLRLGNSADAESYLKEAIAKAPATIRSYGVLAAIQVKNNNLPAAEKSLKEATVAAPKTAEAWIQLGRFYIYEKRWQDAETQFLKAVELDPRNGTTLLDLGRIQNAGGKTAEAEKTFRTLSDLPDPQFRSIHAMFLLQQGKSGDAMAEMEKIVGKNPLDREARTRLIAMYLDQKKFTEATSMLDAALKKNAQDLDALLQRSEINLSRGMLDGVERDLTAVLRARPDDAVAHYLLSRVYLARKADLLRRQELTEALRRNPSLLRVRIELADVLLEASSARDALDVIDAAPDEQKNLPAVAAMRNWAYIAAGDMTAARAGIKQALANSNSPEFLLQDGVLKLQTGDSKGGRASMEQVLKVRPAELRALQPLVNSYFAEKQNQAGIDRIRTAVAQQPGSSPLQDYLGQVLILVGDKAGARAAFEASKAGNPGDQTADTGLAMLDAMEGHTDSARNTLAKLASGSRPNGVAAIRLGMLEESRHDYPAAIAAYKIAADARPDDWVPLNNLSNCLIAAGQYDQALSYAQKAKELAPTSTYVADTMGWVYYNKGMYASAVTQLEPLKNSSMAAARYHLAMAYFRAGDLPRGKTTLDAALRTDPGNPEAKMAKEIASAAMISVKR